MMELWYNLPCCGKCLVSFTALYLLWKFVLKPFVFARRAKEPPIHKKDWKQGVVYLYQFPRPRYVPNLSPFCLKLETWLRIAGVDYEVVESMRLRSRDGKLPFIELDGKHFHDSALIIEQLTERFDKGSVDGETERDRAVSLLCQELIEKPFWLVNIYNRYHLYPEYYACSDVLGLWFIDYLRPLIKRMVFKRVKLMVFAMGVGGHHIDHNELLKAGRRYLKALSAIIGSKKFVLGDSLKVVDATLFGHLASIYYLPFPAESPIHQLINDELPVIKRYLDDVKEAVFPDWDDVVQKGGKYGEREKQKKVE